MTEPQFREHEYVGSLHIHSDYSDGLRPIPEIAGIADSTNLDFLLFADHMTLEPLKKGLEKWYGNVLAIIGYEINDDRNRNHYLAYGLDEILPPEMTAPEYVHAVHEAGATGFIAHPDEKRSAFPEHPPYPWDAWDATGYDGIEIWNHSSEWLEKMTSANKYYHVLHPLKNLKGPEPETLERWDRMNAEKAMPGIGGTDAHAYPYRIGPITIYIFRYKVLFKGIRTHVLLDNEISADVDAIEAKNAVLGALKKARCFISNYRWGDARGFNFYAVSDLGVFRVGDNASGKNLVFKVKLPKPAKISLLRNGKIVASSSGVDLSYVAVEKGAYRVEVRIKNNPWIYSNHIRYREAGQ
jgi:hypothetical protein